MNDLYVGIVENPSNGQVIAVAISFTMAGTLELTEKWIEKQGDSGVRYKIRLCEVRETYIDTSQAFQNPTDPDAG